MASSPDPQNPLPPCPATPNCHRESRSFPHPPAALFADALRCVRELSGFTIGHAVEIERAPDRLGLHATFKIFLFTDDLDLLVAPDGTGAALHVRSASRVGGGDLGTNRRRVRALFDAIDAAPPAATGTAATR